MPAPADYSLVFADEFDRLSIANTTTATANWYAAEAWGGSFGSARFMPAGGSSPFSIVQQAGESALQIEMTRNAAGQLQSGLISNTFPNGTSTTPQDGDPYGYYEARMWLPEGQGVWPAFWAIEQERLSATRDHVFEVDVMEQHGSALPDRYTSRLHDWNWNGTTLEGHTSPYYHQNVVGQGVLTTGWHTYGVKIQPDTMTFYMDGRPHFSLATPATLDTDLMFMIDLAAGGGWPIDPALDHVNLYVDYFRFYELDDGSTADRMEGGAGNDVYVVDHAGDIVSESLAGSNGVDTVQSSISFSLANTARVFGAVENLTLLGAGSISGTGNALNNVLTGNAGANTLNGGLGADNMRGGAGNDVYVVDNASDIVNESVSGSNGIDTIQSSISFSLANSAHVLGAVEYLTLLGAGSISGTGNALNNVLIGNAGANVLNGADGNDTLIGGAGADTLIGGLGNDTYVLKDGADAVSDSGGIDTITSTVNRSLANYAAVENLTLVNFWTARKGIGNALDNVITGNNFVNTLSGGIGNDILRGMNGNDTLVGGVGIDTLTGGLNNDFFVLDAPLSPANRDVITDFSHIQDTFRLENAVMPALGPAGALNPNLFFAGAAAHDANDRVVYNQATGALYFDSNGNAAGGVTQLATLTNKPTLLADDFVVI